MMKEEEKVVGILRLKKKKNGHRTPYATKQRTKRAASTQTIMNEL